MRKLTGIAFIRRILADRKGMGAMELGIAMPILMMLFLGAVDLSRIVAAKIDMEQAAQRVTDLALANRPNNGATNYLVTEARAASGATASEVTVQVFLECDGTRASNFNSACTAGQTQARFASVAIRQTVDTTFDWGALSGVLGVQLIPANITVTGDSVVRFQ
jgi:Flp pilus assembly protein TadG